MKKSVVIIFLTLLIIPIVSFGQTQTDYNKYIYNSDYSYLKNTMLEKRCLLHELKKIGKRKYVVYYTIIPGGARMLQSTFDINHLKNIMSFDDYVQYRKEIKRKYREGVAKRVAKEKAETLKKETEKKRIKSFNDSIISLFTTDLENKKTESLVSHMESLIEYDNIDSLQNNINDKYELDKPLSFTKTERFKEYFVDFIIKWIRIKRKSIKVYNGYIKTKSNAPGSTLKLSEASMKLLSSAAASAAADEQKQAGETDLQFMNINFELKGGEIKTSSTSHRFIDGLTIDYSSVELWVSEDEKKRFEDFKLLNITPKIEPLTIKKEVKLVTLNKTFIHNRKEPLTLYINKNLLDGEDKTTFRGGIWTEQNIFFKKRSNDTEPITTKTFESQKNQIKINLDDTYGLKLKRDGSNLRVDFFEDLNPYFNSADRGKAIDGIFSKDKKLVNVYTEWVYELYIGSKKVNKLFEPEFIGRSPLKNLTNQPYFNKPFYTIDVYQIF